MCWPEVTLVDCTLRDGGFYTRWEYPYELAAAYVRAVDEAGVHYAELGYRSLETDGFAGAYRVTSDDLIDRLPPTRRTQMAVMIDAKDLAGHEWDLDRVFGHASHSRVRLVRVATRLQHLACAGDLVRRLHSLGYATALNLMSAGSLTREESPAILAALSACAADVVYLADSFGSMLPLDVRELGELLGSSLGSSRPWGIHLHNNLELAFANALEAVATGAAWVDVSILGMGRGAGNLRTELLLQYLQSRLHLRGVDARPIHAFIGSHLDEVHRTFRWGPAPPYVLSGMQRVHPTFAQVLIGSGRFTNQEIVRILSQLHEDGCGESFSEAALDATIAAAAAAAAAAGAGTQR